MKYVGCIEIEVNGEFHIFEIYHNQDVFVFGSHTNTGLLQSGYMEISDCFSFDANLQAMIEDIEVYYRDGKEYTNCIVCNDRM